jgi:hypothetical protein
VRDNREGRVTEKCIVLHEFYSKAMAANSVPHARSAMPYSMKKTVLTQDMLRVMLRCSTELDWHEVAKHCSELNKRMQFSGYNQSFRTMVTRSALKAYKEIKAKDESGVAPMYRQKSWNREERERKKKEKKEGWFKSKGEETVIFVPATVRSELKKRCEKVVKDRGMKIRIVERGGVTLKGLLQQSDPFSDSVCDCLVCRTGGGGKCRKEGIVYQLKCDKCQDIYIGESSRNAFTRINEHIRQAANKSKDSVLHRHMLEKHSNDSSSTPEFSAKVIRSYSGSALRRQISESVFIDQLTPSTAINSRSEWNTVHLPRLTLSRGGEQL